MRRPRFSRSAPMEAEASPLPKELTTPPVTKRNLVFLERMSRNPRKPPPPSTALKRRGEKPTRHRHVAPLRPERFLARGMEHRFGTHEVGGRIHAKTPVRRHETADADIVFECSQLFQ